MDAVIKCGKTGRQRPTGVSFYRLICTIRWVWTHEESPTRKEPVTPPGWRHYQKDIFQSGSDLWFLQVSAPRKRLSTLTASEYMSAPRKRISTLTASEYMSNILYDPRQRDPDEYWSRSRVGKCPQWEIISNRTIPIMVTYEHFSTLRVFLETDPGQQAGQNTWKRKSGLWSTTCYGIENMFEKQL